jgi:predicted Zn-dependent protease
MNVKVMVVVVVSTWALSSVMAEDRKVATHPDQSGTRFVGITGPVPDAVLKQYRDVQELEASLKYDDAAAALKPLLASYPAHVDLHLLSCSIELNRGGAQDPGATAACDRAASLAAEVDPAIDVARHYQHLSEDEKARATLVALEARIPDFPADRAAAAWLALADHYARREAVTWAEAAVAHLAAGSNDHGIVAWAASLRARFGLPRDGARYKLKPDDDAAALAAVRDVIARSNASDLAGATTAADAAEKRWPGLPGLLAARCHVALRRGSFAAARQLCARSLAQGESSWALLLSGTLELKKNPRAAAGIAQLRKAIAIDPDLLDAWHALADALRRTKATAELDQLALDFQKRFRTHPPW